MRIYRTFFAATVLLIGTSFCASNAATIEVIDAGSGVALVLVDGEISFRDDVDFRLKTINLPKAIVTFNSPGGNLDAGLSIGKQIRQRGYATLVGAKLCASACALAWLGGAHRYMQRDSRIGFHAAYVQNGEYVRETGMGNALIGAYLSKLGLGDSAIVYMTVSPPEYLNWLDLQSARDLGIDVLLYEDGTVTAVGPSNVRPSENAKRAVRGFFDRYKESGMSGVMVSVEKCYERTASLKSLKSIEYCVELDWCAAYIDEATAKQMKWPKTEYFLAENVSKRFRQASSSLDWQGKMPSQLFEQWKSMAEKVVDGGSISR